MFNNSTKYAIQMVVFLLKRHGSKKKYTSKEIAENLNIPSAFLSKISQELVKKNIISSTKGKGGGFYLTEQNITKTLFDVILIFENEDVISKCILGLPECSDENPCIAHNIYKHFKKELGSLLVKEIIDL
jgi:Rrf2 family protein